ncbi:MAG: histidine ammonia-lyase [Parcubacteria group bacterium]|nr:histidine ammonia-lyase [Parcubacteria group bacterium]
MSNTIEIGPDRHLTPETVDSISRSRLLKVRLSAEARRRTKASRLIVEKMIKDKKVVYGVTTGFGNFKDKIISPDEVENLQKNLIRSHATGVGPLLSSEEVRAAMLVRLNSLSQGYSGVRHVLLDLLCELINRDVTPIVPSQGSVGSSGDLAPLSHIGLVLMGEGEAMYKGKRMSGTLALKSAKLSPIAFAAKEGLAFNNGTSVMTGIAALAFIRARRLADLSDMAAALTIEASCGVSSALDKRIHDLRPHPGQKKSAENIRNLLKGSKLVDSMPGRIQDSYSLRCTPQVHGAARDAISYAEAVLTREINAVTDNPIIFPDGAISGGNFHGEPIAISFDTLGIAVSELANISERRTAKLVDPSTSNGLPAFLIAPEKAGLHSGLMIPQYTAAALVSENKVLAHPASVDSIPTSANQEDHVSMGTIAVRKAAKILDNSEYVLAIEFLTACQGIDFRKPQHLAPNTAKAYKAMRKRVSYISEDRELHKDIEAAKRVMMTFVEA